MITPLSWRAFTLQDKNPPDGGSFISGGKCSPLLSTSRSSSLSSTWWTLSVRFSVTKYWRPSQILESSTCSQLYDNDGDGGEFDVFPIVTPFPFYFFLASRNYDWHGWWQRWQVILTEFTMDCLEFWERTVILWCSVLLRWRTALSIWSARQQWDEV